MDGAVAPSLATQSPQHEGGGRVVCTKPPPCAKDATYTPKFFATGSSVTAVNFGWAHPPRSRRPVLAPSAQSTTPPRHPIAERFGAADCAHADPLSRSVGNRRPRQDPDAVHVPVHRVLQGTDRMSRERLATAEMEECAAAVQELDRWQPRAQTYPRVAEPADGGGHL